MKAAKKNLDTRIGIMRQQGKSVAFISDKERRSIAYVCDVLGIEPDNQSIAFADIHIGGDLDTTGIFRQYSTMKWVA